MNIPPNEMHFLIFRDPLPKSRMTSGCVTSVKSFPPSLRCLNFHWVHIRSSLTPPSRLSLQQSHLTNSSAASVRRVRTACWHPVKAPPRDLGPPSMAGREQQQLLTAESLCRRGGQVKRRRRRRRCRGASEEEEGGRAAPCACWCSLLGRRCFHLVFVVRLDWRKASYFSSLLFLKEEGLEFHSHT